MQPRTSRIIFYIFAYDRARWRTHATRARTLTQLLGHSCIFCCHTSHAYIRVCTTLHTQGTRPTHLSFFFARVFLQDDMQDWLEDRVRYECVNVFVCVRTRARVRARACLCVYTCAVRFTNSRKPTHGYMHYGSSVQTARGLRIRLTWRLQCTHTHTHNSLTHTPGPYLHAQTHTPAYMPTHVSIH